MPGVPVHRPGSMGALRGLGSVKSFNWENSGRSNKRTGVRSHAQSGPQVPVAAPGQYGYTEVQDQTYLGETFWKSVPPREQHESAPWNREDAPDEEAHIGLVSLNHMALGVHDVQTMTRFYTRVLGMRKMPRPPFPFDGAWLEGGGVVLHLIEDDPTIPRKQVAGSWKDQFDVAHPEPWYIRRNAHKAFAVESLGRAELRLKQAGVEFHKFMVPGTNAAQIFLYDPEGNGIELGEGYDEIMASLQGKQP